MRSVLVGFLVFLFGCSSNDAPGTGADAVTITSGPEACVQAGGRCAIGSAVGTASCPIRGPQDCNPDRNPGGAICCLPGSDAGTSDAGGSTAACSWSPTLDDAGPGGCKAERAFVQCSLPNGGGCDCLSNDPTQCPECGPTQGAACQNLCGAGEYGVSCGGIAVPRTQDPPAGCRFVSAVPGGFAFYCCPCQ